MTRFHMPVTSLIFITLILGFTFTPPSFADIPQVISYQGRITDSGGAPVADGTYTVRFRIYDASSGGNLEWDSGDRSVEVTNSMFEFLMGQDPQPGINMEFDESYWLLVTFDGDNQLPRQRMGSVGYAYMASGLVLGTEINGWVNGGFAIKGTNTSTIGISDGVSGESNSTAGRGVFGEATASTGMTFGVYGLSNSTAGRGVYGEAATTTGITMGGYFKNNSSSGTGVYGEATRSTGITYGVYGWSSSSTGAGVYGRVGNATGNNYGVHGETNSLSGRGVYGEVTATAGTTYGVYGESNSTYGTGVYGEVTASTGLTHGVYGRDASTSGTGVRGYVSAPTGSTYGAWGTSVSTSGTGVVGSATASTGTTYGVYGDCNSTSGTGVRGEADATTGTAYGVYGTSASTSGTAVRGWATASTGTTYGVYGRCQSPDGYGVYYVGGLAGTGTKSCVVKTSQGPTLLYCQESPENWFEDFGEGQLVDGKAHIELDPLFLETVTIDEKNSLKVFIQLHDEGSHGVAVKKGTSGFDVVELESGHSNGTFDYRVVAKRKGFEAKRLDYCAAAETDPHLYPELREKELCGREDEKARLEEKRHRLEEERAQTAEMIEATRE